MGKQNKVGTYRLAELLKQESAENFVGSKWMDAVLELHGLNEEGEHPALALNQTHFNIGGPGLPVLKGFHDLMLRAAKPLDAEARSEARDKDYKIPIWATHYGTGSVQPAIKYLLKDWDFDKGDERHLSQQIARILGYNRLYQRPAPAAYTYYTRPWPSSLTLDKLALTGGQAEKFDWRTEQRIAEEATKSEKTLVVVRDMGAVAPPDPAKGVKDFVRWARSVQGVMDYKDERIAKLTSEIEEVNRALEELTLKLEKDELAEAADEIKAIFEGGSHGELDEGNASQATG